MKWPSLRQQPRSVQTHFFGVAGVVDSVSCTQSLQEANCTSKSQSNLSKRETVSHQRPSTERLHKRWCCSGQTVVWTVQLQFALQLQPRSAGEHFPPESEVRVGVGGREFCSARASGINFSFVFCREQASWRRLPHSVLTRSDKEL